jgi:hypothetical protein
VHFSTVTLLRVLGAHYSRDHAGVMLDELALRASDDAQAMAVAARTENTSGMRPMCARSKGIDLTPPAKALSPTYSSGCDVGLTGGG